MKPHPGRYAAIALSFWFVAHPAGAIEINGAAGASARSASLSLASTQVASGVVSAVDGKGGYLVLDGERRFAFMPTTLVVRRQSNQGSPARLADIRAGVRVSLTVVKRSANATAKVSEVWIAP